MVQVFSRCVPLVAWLCLVALVLTPAPSRAQVRDSAAVERRAAQVTAMMGGGPLKADTIFAPSFLAKVPTTQLAAIFAQLAQLGHVQRVSMNPSAPGAAAVQFQVTTDKDFAIPMTLSVEPDAPHLIIGLLFGNPAKSSGSLADVMKEMQSLPGHASLLAARIDGDKLVPVAALDTGRALGIGSAFKLFVLAELVREVERGERHWADVISLDSSSRSLPSGILQTWPVGAPVTLQTVATLMISMSDNTAADHLLHTLGRTNVENVQRLAGNTHAAMNMPFLSTRELFVLKSPGATALLRRYESGDVAERRAVLANPALLARQKSPPDFSKGPIDIEKVEWFASTADLARTMIWLRDHSTAPSTAGARAILSVNKGIAWPSATWSYVGFKGGSEPGVINATFIAQRTGGRWIVLVGTWNDPSAAVDETRFLALITRARDLMSKQ